MLITARRMLHPDGSLQPGWVHVDGTQIVATGVGPARVRRTVDRDVELLAPGFIDLHCHGGGGAGDEDVIGLTAWNLPGTTGAGEIVEGSLEVSYDSGQTWQQLTLTGPVADWSAEVVYPRGAEKVSLRGSATDSEGNAVTMEVIDAYLLPEDDDPEPPGEVEVVRIGGVDRYDVASNVAAVYPDGADTVYIASGQGYPDALTGDLCQRLCPL